MRRVMVAVMTVALMGIAPAAVAQHPSENRNEQGFGGGPHCHVVAASPQQNPAYPSHTGHVHAGNDIFNADLDCDGQAG